MIRSIVRGPVLAIALLSSAAGAAPVAVMVRGADGAPLAGAVVTLEVAGAGVAALRGPYSVEQRDIQFQPHVAIVPVGATVAFPNRDKVRHHVYSFSPARKFELKLYAREDDRAVTFDKAGIVALGCNIHDRMSAYVAVVDTPWAAKTDANGMVRLANVPGGAMTVTVWHPALRAPGSRAVKTIRVADTASHAEGFAVPLRPGVRTR